MRTATLSGIIFAGLAARQAQAGNLLAVEQEMGQALALQGDSTDDAGRQLAGAEDDEGVEALLEAALGEDGSDLSSGGSGPSEDDDDSSEGDGKRGWGRKSWGGKGKGRGRKGAWGKKGAGKKGGMLKAFGAFGKGGFDEEKYQQLMDKVGGKMEQMAEKKLAATAKWLGMVCEQLQGDQPACQAWADAQLVKAREYGGCKSAAKSAMGACLGDYLSTAASYFRGMDSSNDDAEEPADAEPALSPADVGDCYARSLDSLQTCAVDAAVAVEAAMEGVEEPDEEALQAAIKAVKQEMRGKKAGKRRRYMRSRRGRGGRGGRRQRGGYGKGGYGKGGYGKGGYSKGGSKSGGYNKGGYGRYSKGGYGRGGYNKGGYEQQDYDRADKASYKGGY